MTVGLEEWRLGWRVLQPNPGHDWCAGDQRVDRLNHLLSLLLELCKLRAINPVPILVKLAKPRVQEGILSSDPLAGILHEQLLHKVFRGHRYVLPLPVTELILTLHVLVQDFIRAVALEKRSASQNDIKYDANAKDVSLAVVALFLEELGGDVARAAAPQI